MNRRKLIRNAAVGAASLAAGAIAAEALASQEPKALTGYVDGVPLKRPTPDKRYGLKLEHEGRIYTLYMEVWGESMSFYTLQDVPKEEEHKAYARDLDGHRILQSTWFPEVWEKDRILRYVALQGRLLLCHLQGVKEYHLAVTYNPNDPVVQYPMEVRAFELSPGDQEPPLIVELGAG